MLTRWIEDFDCGYETNWWYIIKDTPFQINALKAKRRYEINKGIKNFDVRQITPPNHLRDLYAVACAAYEEYPEAYRPNITEEQFAQGVKAWEHCIWYGAFHRETNQLCGYANLARTDNYIDFQVLKAIPTSEKAGVNAALVHGILQDQKSFLEANGYICDGSRSINHETAFQDYLEKYFGFRKAYCTLHIRYKWWLGVAIKCLYPFRKLLKKFDSVSTIHLVNSLLKMEEYSAKRNQCV